MLKRQAIDHNICSCGKKKYTKRLAQELKNSILKKFGKQLFIYQCKFCNYFHLTKKNWNSKK